MTQVGPTPPGEPVPSGGGADAPAGPAGPPQLEPLPYDGVLSVTVGTAVWFVALIIMLPLAGRLNDGGHLWWLATAAVGFGLGLVGIRMTSRRRARLRAAAEAARPAAG
jgi:Protein of unknown function (DUF2530)